jgi:3-phosphoshikimate 1-carboxyvinyltransferase
LHITGRQLNGGKVQIRADVSSQYISALLLCAPAMKEGLTLQLIGKIGSFPYIHMTLELMRALNISYSMVDQVIQVEPGAYAGEEVWVESDWSAASYYFSMVALSPGSHLVIHGLHQDSLQGDRVLSDIYQLLGVQSTWEDKTLHLTNIPIKTDYFIYDFSNCPDLAQTVAITCAALGVKARLSGLESLRIKETDRTAALATELEKYDVRFWQEGADWLLDGKCAYAPGTTIHTYEDHRMAMCFAPLALLQPVKIEDAGVVAKSYPSFWDDLKRLGFSFS